MTPKEIQRTLATLGYYDGPLDADLSSANFRDDARRYQEDEGLVPDGVVGPKTIAALRKRADVLKTLVVPSMRHLVRWRCTSYYIGEVSRWGGARKVAMRAPGGELIASVPWRAFAEAALEGTTRLLDGRLANVAHPPYSPVDAAEYEPIRKYASAQGWLPDRPGYAGILTTPDGKMVTRARNFQVVTPGPGGYPVIRGRECTPFRTLAADIGVLPKHDPAFRKLGGVVPIGTRVLILEYVGRRLPGGAVHDGWFTVNDTGGGIYGAHFDVFTGTSALRASGPPTPRTAHVWWEGCEKLGMNYAYGLR